jgi:hypothetical protein
LYSTNLLNIGEAGVPEIEDWLEEELKQGDKVGQNAKLASIC